MSNEDKIANGFKKAFYAGVGAAAFTAEAIGKGIDALAKKGEEVSNSAAFKEGKEHAKEAAEETIEFTKKTVDTVVNESEKKFNEWKARQDSDKDASVNEAKPESSDKSTSDEKEDSVSDSDYSDDE
ncbi:MAG: hypothetical protein SPL99_02605 [Catonella sp.]|nr:hypothetical protein [Catonella sp.]MDY6355917.1 hypothetical protein [Catonella sp.]